MDLYADRPTLARPKREGHVDGQQLAAVAAQHVYLANNKTLQEMSSTMTATTDLLDRYDAKYVQAIVQREGESAWRWSQETDDKAPIWPARAISESVCSDPDLRVMPDAEMPWRSDKAVFYRRALPDHMVSNAPAQWVPISNLKSEYGGKGRDEDVNGIDSWLADAMMLAEQTITRGCAFIGTDGEYRARYDDVEKGWTLTTTDKNGYGAVRAGAHSWQCREPDFKPSRDLKFVREAEARDLTPMTYTVETGLTLKQSKALSDEAMDILKDFTGHYDTGDSWYNACRSLASMFLRSHPETAYVYQGPGGSGKSTIAKDLARHLDRQATTMSLDLLNQPTAMSTENAMGSLSSHLLALSDDYDPRYGRFEKIIAPLKTLLTGLLPYAARRRGEDSFEARPQAVHLITTNFHLPIDDSEAEQRRFAFATIADPGHETLKRYREFVAEHGFWPFMLASCQAWLAAGDMQCQDTAYANVADLDDLSVDLLRQVVTDGYVLAASGSNGGTVPRYLWRNLGLKRSTKRLDGKVRSIYRPYRRDENKFMYSIWNAQRRALMGEEQIAPAVAEEPHVDLRFTTDEWAAVLADAGVRPRLFPCVSEGGKAKAPDADKLRRIAGTPSWQKAAANPKLDLSRTRDDSDAHGMTVAPDMVWLDLDAHGTDGETGWTRANRAFGPYGSEHMPKTFAVSTPSGGMHLLYRIPEGLKLKSRANADTQIDLRIGGKGYVVAAGSHTDKGDYKAVDMPDDGKVPALTQAMTAWLADHGYVDGAPAKPASAPMSRAAFDPAMRNRETPWVNFPTMTSGDTHDKLVSEAMRIAAVAAKHGRSQRWIDDAMLALRDRVPAEHLTREPNDWANAVRSACARAGVACTVA